MGRGISSFKGSDPLFVAGYYFNPSFDLWNFSKKSDKKFRFCQERLWRAGWGAALCGYSSLLNKKSGLEY